MALETELKFFNANRAKWLADHKGKFVLVKGEELVGAFDTAENAYVEGVGRFGNTPFLVKQILDEEPVLHVPVLTLGLLSAHP